MNFCTEIIGFCNETKNKMQKKCMKSSMIYEHQNINLHFCAASMIPKNTHSN